MLYRTRPIMDIIKKLSFSIKESKVWFLEKSETKSFFFVFDSIAKHNILFSFSFFLSQARKTNQESFLF